MCCGPDGDAGWRINLCLYSLRRVKFPRDLDVTVPANIGVWGTESRWCVQASICVNLTLAQTAAHRVRRVVNANSQLEVSLYLIDRRHVR